MSPVASSSSSLYQLYMNIRTKEVTKKKKLNYNFCVQKEKKRRREERIEEGNWMSFKITRMVMKIISEVSFIIFLFFFCFHVISNDTHAHHMHVVNFTYHSSMCGCVYWDRAEEPKRDTHDIDTQTHVRHRIACVYNNSGSLLYEWFCVWWKFSVCMWVCTFCVYRNSYTGVFNVFHSWSSQHTLCKILDMCGSM